MDDRTLGKWVGFEADRIHRSLAAKKKSLHSFLEEAQPSYPTRGGERITIDRNALHSIAESLDVEERHRTKVPVDMTADSGLENEAYITAEPVARALRGLEGFGEAYRFREGKMHLPMPLAVEIVAKYSGVFQFISLVS